MNTFELELLDDEQLEAKFEEFLGTASILGIRFYTGRFAGRYFLQAVLDFTAAKGLKVSCLGRLRFPSRDELLDRGKTAEMIRQVAAQAFEDLVNQNLAVGGINPFALPAPIG